MRCIGYLCQSHHDLDLPFQDVCKKVLTGQYIFHAFSTKMWFELSCQYLRSATKATLSADFTELLQRLWTFRTTEEFVRAVNLVSHGRKEYESQEDGESGVDFKLFRRDHPMLHRLLCKVAQVRNSSSVPSLEFSEGTSASLEFK